MSCRYCGCDMHPEREEMFDYCTREDCYKQGFRGPEYVVLGVHKSTPVIMSIRDSLVTANKSYMVTK